MKSFCLLAWLLLGILACAQPATPLTPLMLSPELRELERRQEAAPNVQIDLQIVRLPRATATPLVAEFMDEKTGDQANAKLQKLLADGRAKLIAWPMVITRSGQRGMIEGVNEIRYATEFEPGGVEIHIHNREGVVEKMPEKLTGINLNPVASAFETRNVGATLEVEPILSDDGQTISLNLVPQHVVLKGMRKTTIERRNEAAPKGVEQIVSEQPDFETHKANTGLKLKNGARLLLSSFPVEPDGDDLELFILHAVTRAP